MARMAGGACPEAPVRIHPADALVGPIGKAGDHYRAQIRRVGASAGDLDAGAMAAVTRFVPGLFR